MKYFTTIANGDDGTTITFVAQCATRAGGSTMLVERDERVAEAAPVVPFTSERLRGRIRDVLNALA